MFYSFLKPRRTGSSGWRSFLHESHVRAHPPSTWKFLYVNSPQVGLYIKLTPPSLLPLTLKILDMSPKSLYISALQGFEDGSLVLLKSFFHHHPFFLSFHIYPGFWTSPEMNFEHPPACSLLLEVLCSSLNLALWVCTFWGRTEVTLAFDLDAILMSCWYFN